MQPIALSPIQAAVYALIVDLYKGQGGGPVKVRPKFLTCPNASRPGVLDALRRLQHWGLIKITPGQEPAHQRRTITIDLLHPDHPVTASRRGDLMDARRKTRLEAGGTSTPDKPAPHDTGKFSKRWAELGLPPLGYATLCK